MMRKYLTPITLCSATLLAGSAAVYAGDDEDLSGPREDVQESAAVLQQMHRQGDELGGGLDAAKGIFVVPDYATAALIIGGAGGEGVLFNRQQGEFGNPVFYDIGSLSVGAQAGAAAGSIALLLMTDEAVASFEQENNFSLNAEAGLTIINWSGELEWSAGKGDVVVWSDTEGLLGEVAIGVSDINFDAEETREYYDQEATPQQILAGEVQNPHASELRSEFAAFTGSQTGQAGHGAGQSRDMDDKDMDRELDTWNEGEQTSDDADSGTEDDY